MWFPLESNPDVMNKYMRRIGVKEPKMLFTDVYGVTPEFLDMVPTPVGAVLFVFPLSKDTAAQTAALVLKQREELEAFKEANTFFFTRQNIGNACGTIAILHAILNNYESIGDVEPGSVLHLLSCSSFERDADGVKQTNERPEEIIEESEELATAHAEAAYEGSTEQQPIEASINLHFVCYVHVGGRCIEMDGRLPGPVLHGHCGTNREFLDAAGRAIKEKMDLDTSSFEYCITALCGIEPATE